MTKVVTKVLARAQRSDQWWAVEVPELPGLFTQARRLDQIPEMVQDAAAALGHGRVEVEVEPHLSAHGDEVVEATRKSQADASEASRAASSLSRKTVHELRSTGLTVRDVAALLGISPQRVSQLLATNAR